MNEESRQRVMDGVRLALSMPWEDDTIEAAAVVLGTSKWAVQEEAYRRVGLDPEGKPLTEDDGLPPLGGTS